VLAPSADKAAKASAAKARRAAAVENPVLKRAATAWRTGRYDQAARLYEKFAADHPGDARAEDASYLRTLSLERGGRHEEARAAAQLYLARFPGGFRRTELESFVAGSKSR
jgi:outer membrane protein assembly factor BamD (BamD/ComL family)